MVLRSLSLSAFEPVYSPLSFLIRSEGYGGLKVSPDNLYKMEELIIPGKHEFTDPNSLTIRELNHLKKERNCFHFLTIVIHMHYIFLNICPGHMSRSWIAGSHGSPIFSFF